jgi:hypothetical protein
MKNVSSRQVEGRAAEAAGDQAEGVEEVVVVEAAVEVGAERRRLRQLTSWTTTWTPIS